MNDLLIPPPRIVKPRHRKYPYRSIIAVSRDEALTEDGEVLTMPELIERIPELPSSIFAPLTGPDFVGYLESVYAEKFPTSWQVSYRENAKAMYQPNKSKQRMVQVIPVINFFGFKNGNYHKLLDPLVMYGVRLQEVWPAAREDFLGGMLAWAMVVRDFCDANDLDVRPTAGGIAVQFLRDPRFYPEPRRKVPAAINARARQELPGNHYRLYVVPRPGRTYDAYEVDQHRAHHHHARILAFPHPNHLYAFGHFLDLDRVWRSEPSYLAGLHDNGFHGLYCLDLKRPRFGAAMSWLPRNQETHHFVFTNELSHLLDMGYEVTGVRAAWGSHHRDYGLNKYATWACEQLTEYDNARWLKRILLAAYGTLASSPSYGEVIFRLAKDGQDVVRLTGKHRLAGKLVRRPRKLEPNIANVIHRGMIEAATRSESIGMATWLTSLNLHVLSIYADAVFVKIDADFPLPNLIEPWEVKREHSHWEPLSEQAWRSDQDYKDPGNHFGLKRSRRMVRVPAPSAKPVVRGLSWVR